MRLIRRPRAAFYSVLGTGFAALLAVGPALAVRPPAGQKENGQRFKGDRPATRRSDPGTSRRARLAVELFNHRTRGRFNLKVPGGLGLQGSRAATVAVKDVAKNFLRDNAKNLGLDPSQLRLELGRSISGMHHLRFEQIIDGIPVMFSNVRVHLREDGSIVSVRSSFIPGIETVPVPQLTEAMAAARVSQDLPGSQPRAGGLVFFPDSNRGSASLAWRFKASGGGGRWIYYVDAKDGSILLRYNNLNFQVCATSGTIHGEVFDIDPDTTPGPVLRPMRHQNVYVVDASSAIPTDDNGLFCDPDTLGKMFTLLQGPYASVANFHVPNAHYTNGGDTWQTFASPLSSPHPYPNSSVLISTINAPAGAVLTLPNFSSFDVGDTGLIAGDYEILDNDQVSILDANGNKVATYIGDNLASFKGAMVPGTQLRFRLQSNAGSQHNGFDVNISSYMTMTDNPTTPVNQTATFTWTNTRTEDASRDEINLFYQINLMHDYFSRGVNISGAAPIDKPVPVMAKVGPNLANAFYDPEHGNLTFGDVGNGFAFDGSVVRHEYVHFVIDQIYPIINFGQFGAISEGLSDYFAASSLGISKIGAFTASAFGTVGALRELDCVTNGGCVVFPTNWVGSVHEDSRSVSQSLWEIRTSLISTLGASNGQSCADGLVFQALFFYPDSFGDFLDSMLQVSADSATLVPTCGANNTQNGLIQAQFSTHGIYTPATDQDIYEPNDGIASATDISTATTISARIFPQADLDYYVLGSGRGQMTLEMNLPANSAQVGTYQAFAMTLINSKYQIVAEAQPSLNINPTLSGYCPDTNCLTSDPSFKLEYFSTEREQYYLMVHGPGGDQGFVTNNNSTEFYSLSPSFNNVGPISGNIVTASFDADVISYEVNVTTFVKTQSYTFSHARLLDHAFNVLPGAGTNDSSPFLTSVSATSALGKISGSVKIASGFDARYAAVGTVFLEVFATNTLGRVQSMGYSNAINLTAKTSEVRAFNNVFNPLKGQFTTVKYETESAGRLQLRLYTRNGRHILTLLDTDHPGGKGSIDWNGKNIAGNNVASGIYLLHAEGPGLSETKKIIVVK